MRDTDLDVAFCERYNLISDEYEGVSVTTLPFSVRVINRFKGNGITTVAELLKTSPSALMKMKGFGKNCLVEVDAFCATLNNDDSIPIVQNKKASLCSSSLFINHRNEIAVGNFSVFEDMDLSEAEVEMLQRYREAYDILGEELAFECVTSTENVFPIIEMFVDYQSSIEKHIEIWRMANALPNTRKNNKALGYINAFTLDENERSVLKGLCESEETSLLSMAGTDKVDDFSTYILLKKFFKWCAFDLEKEINDLIVICAPYKHLVKQWADDVEKAFPDAKLIMVSSENPTWETQIAQEIIRKQYKPDNQIIIISTIASFKMERFTSVISRSKEDKLLIVDEAHRFTDRPDKLKEMFRYMLGLSATPFSGSSAHKGLELMEWFGGQVFNLPIENALERGFLVPYNYYPIYVYATEDEERRFKYHTQKILSCFKNNKCINPDLLVKSLRNRLRVISMVEEKTTRIDEIINRIAEKDHFVVYCGDGKLFDADSGKELRHIQAIKRVLTAHGFKASQFTATENMADRMELVDAFNKQEISALVAIRCLDEGINIPSIKSALILSSNDDYREFVQRRGRILRTYGNKKYANIYDVIVLPSYDMQGWAKIELRRFHEYARLALNWNDLEVELTDHLGAYGLTIEDVDVYDYEGMEELIDE